MVARGDHTWEFSSGGSIPVWGYPHVVVSAGEVFQRARLLTTRRVTLLNLVSGQPEELTRLDWSTAWALAGPRPASWRWVQRRGKLPCGCLRNPLTRRLVLITTACPHHGVHAESV